MRKKKRKGQVKVNHDYFALSSRLEQVRYFLAQGHVWAHIRDRYRWHIHPRLFRTASFPTHLEIEAASACQMRCPMCKTTEMYETGVKFAGIMKFDLYKKIIDEAAESSLYSIKLSWRGESLLNKRVVDMVRYAKDRGIKDVAFLSNGEKLTPKISEQLVLAGLDWISISFDGMGETYNRIRKPAIFEETYEKIKTLRSVRTRLKSKKPLIRVQTVRSAIRGQEDEFYRMWEGVADRVNFIADQVRSLNRKDYKHDPTYICPTPWQRMCISWDGKVAQCFSDYTMQNVLGDASKTSVKHIWQDKPFMELRDKMKNQKRLSTKPCRTCSDGGKIEEEEIVVGGRTINAARYVTQSVDVTHMEAVINRRSKKKWEPEKVLPNA